MIKKLDRIQPPSEGSEIQTLVLYVNDIRHTLNELIDTVNRLTEEEPKGEWPKTGDNYWFFYPHGEIEEGCLKNHLYEKDIIGFGNIFKTKEEAIIARNKVKELLKSLKK